MKKFNSIYLILLIIASISYMGCARRHTITIAGSTAFLPFAEQLAEDYMKINPGVNINVQGGGSAVGIQAALDGTAQIGMADLVTLPASADSLKKIIVANDGIVIIVHPRNNVESLSGDQVKRIYAGVIKNWKEIGGTDDPITVVSREAGSGTRASFEDLALKGIELTGNAVIANSNGTVRETIINDPNSIGYVSLGILNESVKAVKVDGVPPSCESINAGRYKLIRPIFLLLKQNAETQVFGIIDYMLGSEGQKTIQEQGLLPANLCVR